MGGWANRGDAALGTRVWLADARRLPLFVRNAQLWPPKFATATKAGW